MVNEPAPLVSVIIASYNYARFLGEAIESALGQTYSPVEVIVVDDGSSDDSVALARRHPVRVIEVSGQGVARVRNRGAREANGELIVFLDSDDVLEPTFVEHTWRALSACGAEVAYAYPQMQRFGLETELFASRPFHGPALFDGNYVPISSLLRKSAFEAVGGFDSSWPAHEDHELWARLFVRGYSGVFVPEPLLRYRFHGQSRNSISDRAKEALHVRLMVQHPQHGWRWMLKNPKKTARALLRRGR